MYEFRLSGEKRRDFSALPALFAALCACSSEAPIERPMGLGMRPIPAGMSGAPVSVAGASGSFGVAGQPGLAGSTSVIIDSGPPADPEKGCAAMSATAPPASIPKVDIVWVVDASGSM